MGAETVRQAEPAKKPRKKGKAKKTGGRSGAGLRKIEDTLVPGFNPSKDASKNWMAEQRRIWNA